MDDMMPEALDGRGKAAPLIRRYPAGHEKAGQMVVRRNAPCPCGGVIGEQFAINPDHLAAMAPAARAAMEREFASTVNGVRALLLPAECPKCHEAAIAARAPRPSITYRPAGVAYNPDRPEPDEAELFGGE